MKHVVIALIVAGIFVGLMGSVVAVGQETDEPAVEQDKEKDKDEKGGGVEPADPFDPRHRRTRTESEADLDILKKHALDSSTESLLEFFRKRTLADGDRARAATLVEQLGSTEFRQRERAMNEILRIGSPMLEFLRAGAKGSDLEQVRRADSCIDRIRAQEPPADVAAAAIRLLSKRGVRELAPVLLAYIPYADSDYILDEARTALQALARRDAATHVDFLAALTNGQPRRRAAAGEALAHVADHVEKAKTLLADADPVVRLRVARELLLANDKSAMPTLIATLPLVPSSHAWPAEDLLHRLAEGLDGPALPRTGNDAARKKYADAWANWWTKNEKKVDLARLHVVPEMLGHTVIVLLDLGRVLELNAKNETVWQIEGVVFPLDVQLLANGNVLVAEYHAGRVSERDRFRGDIKWEKAINGPLMAQRLPNRNTFIATDSQVMEVNEKGEEVYSFNMPGLERLMKVVKTGGGEIVAVTSEGRVVRFDEKGKVLGSFAIDLNMKLFGGRIDVLPNGRVLIPHNSENKVVEYDAQGQVVWECEVPQPVAATRLPNGNTLVTTMQPQTGAMEFDRNGRETSWNYRHNTRVTRAIRR